MAYKAEHTFRNIKKKMDDDQTEPQTTQTQTATPAQPATTTPATTTPPTLSTKEATLKSFTAIGVYVAIMVIAGLISWAIVKNIQPFNHGGSITYGGWAFCITISLALMLAFYKFVDKYWSTDNAGKGVFIIGLICYGILGAYYYNSTEYKTSKKVTTKRTTPTIKWEREFIGEFDDSDINPDDKFINVLTWSRKYKDGDIVEIDGYVPNGAKEIHILNCLDCTPKWDTTVKGKYKHVLKDIPYGMLYGIWIQPNKGISFKVYISKKIITK